MALLVPHDCVAVNHGRRKLYSNSGQWVIAAILAVSVSEVSHIFAKQKWIVMSRRLKNASAAGST
jgi:hypothetical protein